MIATSNIYLITNDENGKQYIGQSINPEDRFKQHIKDSKNRDYYLYRAMRKYGIESFSFTVIEENIPIEEIGEKEREYIFNLNTKSPHGYNLTDGGEGTQGYTHTEETRLKLSKMKKGKFTHFQTDETKRKISESNRRRKVSEETKRKIGMANKGRKRTEEQNEAMSELLKGKKKTPSQKENLKKYFNSLSEEELKTRISSMIEARSQSILMLDMNTKQPLQEFESIRKAAEWLRVNTENKKASHTRISVVCGDTTKKAYGYHWISK